MGCGFNTQPPEGGWYALEGVANAELKVSTHSRPKAAGKQFRFTTNKLICFNTQPPEGGWTKVVAQRPLNLMFQHTAARRRLVNIKSMHYILYLVSTHSRPKAAGSCYSSQGSAIKVSTHSRPKAAGMGLFLFFVYYLFQHTAARRRLVPLIGI